MVVACVTTSKAFHSKTKGLSWKWFGKGDYQASKSTNWRVSNLVISLFRSQKNTNPRLFRFLLSCLGSIFLLVLLIFTIFLILILLIFVIFFVFVIFVFFSLVFIFIFVFFSPLLQVRPIIRSSVLVPLKKVTPRLVPA